MSSGDAAPAAAAAPPPHPSGLTADERYQLLRSVGQECQSEAELRNLVDKKPDIRCYDGFEPSGRMHIAQGIFKSINVNKCTKAGCTFTFWVADWFALMNDKLGGELDKIRTVGAYLVEVWTAAGMDMSKVDFRWSSDDINKNAKEYWMRVIDIGRKNTITRMKKCCQIMGRQEGSLSAAQVLYPLMQCADIFFLKADICQLGLDQRKVNMLAREYCDSIGRKLKPVILSHHMLSGLVKGMGKMSKSNPDSAIFMEDSAEEVTRKITAAYCPREKQQAEYTEEGKLVESDEINPCLDYINCCCFAVPNGTFKAGGCTFATYEEVEAAFIDGSLSEADLKAGLIDVINALLDPVRNHFATNDNAKQLLEKVKEYRKAGAAPAAAPAEEEAAAAEPHAPRLVAWMPVDIHVPLSTAVTMVDQLNAFVAKGEDHSAVLIVPDWSAYATTAAGGEEKDIAAACTMQLAMMKALGLNERVEIKRQSEYILADPNAYWLSVIAAGRKFSLDQIEAAYNNEAPHAGHVVASLMRLADIALLKATSVVCVKSVDAALSKLATTFTNGACSACDVPALAFRPTLCDPASEPTTADDWLYCDESELDIRRKMKRAFAAPENDNSTVAEIGCYIIRSKGVLTVKRSEANGGDLDFKDPAELLAKCKAGELHPGDLKAAVSPAVLELTRGQREQLGTADVKKAATALKNLEKKLAKAKK